MSELLDEVDADDVQRATPVAYALFMLLRCLLGYRQLLQAAAAEAAAGSGDGSGGGGVGASVVSTVDAAARRDVARHAALERRRTAAAEAAAEAEAEAAAEAEAEEA